MVTTCETKNTTYNVDDLFKCVLLFTSNVNDVSTATNLLCSTLHHSLKGTERLHCGHMGQNGQN